MVLAPAWAADGHMHVPDPPDQPLPGQQDRGDRAGGERVVLGDVPAAA
ncbi:hypothetical protein ACOZ38_29245 [Sphaerisporangium viridialbum]